MQDTTPGNSPAIGSIVLPRRVHELREFLTPADELFTKTHLGEPTINVAEWRLNVGGLVERSLSLSIDELLRFPQAKVTAFHKCAGSPLHPLIPTPDDVGNVVWSGVRLLDILSEANPNHTARFVWSSGQDFGSYRGAPPQHYCKDLSLERAVRTEVLLATHINGKPLATRHGGPVRLVVPGYYGTNSVKWLTSLQLAAERAPSVFTTKYYVDTVQSADGTCETRPVWAVAPDSAIVSPAPDTTIACGRDLVVSGWA